MELECQANNFSSFIPIWLARKCDTRFVALIFFGSGEACRKQRDHKHIMKFNFDSLRSDQIRQGKQMRSHLYTHQMEEI